MYVAVMNTEHVPAQEKLEKISAKILLLGIPANYACFYNLQLKEDLLIQFQPGFLQHTKVRNFLSANAKAINSFLNIILSIKVECNSNI